MEFNSLPVEKEEPEALQIKVEVLEPEDTSYHPPEEEIPIDQHVIKEETTLESDIPKHQCKICEIIVPDEQNLEEHMNSAHQEESSECESRNEKQKHNRKLNLYKCEFPSCEKVFKTSFNLKRHAKTHKEVKVKEERTSKCSDNLKLYKCNIPSCEKNFKTSFNLKRHALTHKEGEEERPFICLHPGCSKTYKTKNSLKEHIVVHGNEKKYRCHFQGCGKMFKLRNVLTGHLRCHRQDAPYKCMEQGCTKAFKAKYNLTRHQLTHLPDSDPMEKIFVCNFPECTSTFRFKDSFKKHSRMHEWGKRFRCSFDGCKAAFYDKRDLENHTRLHTGERLSCSFEGCPKSFPSKRRLLAHKRTHSGKTFSCTYENCKKSFKSNEYLRNHLRRHQEKMKKSSKNKNLPKFEDRYKCSFCGDTFSEETVFQEHIGLCGVPPKIEFVEIEQIKTEIVDLKMECESYDDP